MHFTQHSLPFLLHVQASLYKYRVPSCSLISFAYPSLRVSPCVPFDTLQHLIPLFHSSRVSSCSIPFSLSHGAVPSLCRISLSLCLCRLVSLVPWCISVLLLFHSLISVPQWPLNILVVKVCKLVVSPWARTPVLPTEVQDSPTTPPSLR